MVNADINLTPTATLLEVDPAESTLSSGSAVSKITGRSWGSVSDCPAAVLLIHGLGAHSGWFEPLARRLKVRKLFVLAYDLVGFGKRIKEHYHSPKQWLFDLSVIYSHLHSLTGGKPIYLLGNSMGCIVALQACPVLKPAGLALLSPGFAGHAQTFPLSYRLKTIIRAILSPDRDLLLPYDLELVTRDVSVRNWLSNDPERRFAVPGRMLLDLLKITQGLRWNKISISCPVLMLTADKDRLVDNQVNNQIFERLLSPQKSQRCFDTESHDLPLDHHVDEVAHEIADWIGKTRPAKGAEMDSTSNKAVGISFFKE